MCSQTATDSHPSSLPPLTFVKYWIPTENTSKRFAQSGETSWKLPQREACDSHQEKIPSGKKPSDGDRSGESDRQARVSCRSANQIFRNLFRHGKAGEEIKESLRRKEDWVKLPARRQKTEAEQMSHSRRNDHRTRTVHTRRQVNTGGSGQGQD